MPKRKTNPDESATPEGGQINFRASPALHRRLQEVASGLGLDMANLVRMVVTENLRIYEERVRRLQGDGPGEDH